ncbi:MULTISPECIES: FAD-dependent oxidoreductase [unclassified Rathayibacter]|uniref:L-aspartate oxidase n=1 Tax=unclassified Rathayibacter TaxID=2609250 RepID=UPI00104E09B6|nr:MULTISPECIES: FAD-dependent oxidoreductase [unclassified Rathayibacter]MCJ1703940.1 FAD-binding protein [Rathayibacter sp. VKM Ac-2926]TCL82529.1 succinate dehydrogenase / fumarate reductase flavoprotein subunit [Rathayibacter sp. PhB192]TCM27868.1 succinate dehydrogenase / fumarate reductase flavoprotein subunit [Rathayibacter sp. PhB179]
MTTSAPTATAERRISTSVLVIGTGGSGLRAAIELAEAGVDVLALGKRSKSDAHTSLAAGGINAALATMDPDDSWQQHAADTITESYQLANPHTVEIVTSNAARGIQDLERYGMPFAREDDGRISQRFFGAHTYRRTAFAGDYTGLEIQRTLVNRAAQLDIPILDTVYVTRILVNEDGAVFGAYGFDLVDGTRYLIHADAVILAAGGHNRIWRRTSSRRDENTGDSFRLAVEAGGRLRDPELVQFHPSGIIEPENAAGTLISEAARGEGGILRNGLGERFMGKYDPERMELSTRDRVALACYTEIKEGRGTPNGGVWLDVSHLPRETIMTRLPRVYQTMLELQMLDITKDPIEIAPTAHYSMGGVWVRSDDHSTDVPGLYAIGEASSGLHGANRLGGNSLIELLVFGRIVGQAAAEYSASLTAQTRSAASVQVARDEIADLLAADGEENVRALQRAIRNTMTEHAGVVRDEAGLLAGLAELDAIEARIADIGIHPDIAGFQDLAHAFDLKSAAMAARATLEAALERRESRGCHNRSDYPDIDPALQVNLVWSPSTGITREDIPAVPEEIQALIREVATAGKLLE